MIACQSPMPFPPDYDEVKVARNICNYNLRRLLFIQDSILRVEAVLDFVLREPLMGVFLENEPVFREALREAVAIFPRSPASTTSIRRKSRLVWKAFYRFQEE